MTDSYPDNNPKTAFGTKKLPMATVPPALLHYAAMAFADGAAKYGPFNWREKKVSASIYYEACLRHLMAWFDGEEVAEDSGVPHLAHAVACVAILIDVYGTATFNDNRPPKGPASRLQKGWVDGIYSRRPSEGASQKDPGSVPAGGLPSLASAERDGQALPGL
jgi:hypothetical protein